jgi:hypothetical protein
MTKAEAHARVLKLREMTEARGASANEARVASAKADRLVRKFGLDMRAPRQAKPSSRRPSFVSDVFGVSWPTDWAFDVQTGEHIPNVKVHEYRNPANWRIEIDVDADADARWEAKRGSLHS